MKAQTKAELAAENAQLRDFIAALHEAAASVPLAVYGDKDAELRRARETLIEIGVQTALPASIPLTARAKVIRETAGRPVRYQAFTLAGGSRA